MERLNPQFDDKTGLLTLVLEHGKANEMGTSQLEAWERLCDEIEVNDAIRCLCVTSRRMSSKGTPLFIAGANVTERIGWNEGRLLAHLDRQRSTMIRVHQLPVFTTAVVHGVALGWGLELCLAVDRVYVTDDAMFAAPETGLGIVPGALGTALLAERVGRSTALWLGCSGARVRGAESLRLGLADERVADVDAGLKNVGELARMLSKASPTAIAAFKRAVQRGMGRRFDERVALEREAYVYTVTSGQASLGRESFNEIRRGEIPNWGPRHTMNDE